MPGVLLPYTKIDAAPPESIGEALPDEGSPHAAGVHLKREAQVLAGLVARAEVCRDGRVHRVVIDAIAVRVRVPAEHLGHDRGAGPHVAGSARGREAVVTVEDGAERGVA